MKTICILLVQMALWVVFSGYFDLFFLSAGAISSALSVFVLRRLSRAVAADSDSERRDLSFADSARFVAGLSWYPSWIFSQVVLSAWYVTKKVFMRDVTKLQQGFVIEVVSTTQNSGLGAFLLANSITLTPGTVGMRVMPDYSVKVLALDRELLSGVGAIDNAVRRVAGGSSSCPASKQD
ncbi:MAG: Na+/H+ antiporter subunit E [Anaplasma sp.]